MTGGTRTTYEREETAARAISSAPVVPVCTAHGAWVPGSGVLVWVVCAAAGGGGVLDGPEALPERVLPAALEAALRARRRFRNRVELPARAGEGRQRRVPAVAFGLGDAADLLGALADAAPGGGAGAAAQGVEALGLDLRFLVAVAAGVRAFVRAGHVVPGLECEDGAWWPRWRLPGGDDVAAWLAALTRTAPELLGELGGDRWAEDLAAALTPATAVTLLPRVERPSALVAALQDELPWDVPDVTAGRVARLFDEWGAVGSESTADVVLRLYEPAGETIDGPEAPGYGAADAWRLEPCVRTAAGALVPLLAAWNGPARRAAAAGGVLDGVRRALPWLDRRPIGSAGAFLLGVEDAVRLVEEEAATLRTAGATLLVPRAWTRVAPVLRPQLRTVEPEGATARADDSGGRVPISAQVRLDWEVVLGDVTLTRAEIEELVAEGEAARELLYLRDAWVRVDSAVLRRVLDYVWRADGDEPGDLPRAVTRRLLLDPPPALLDLGEDPDSADGADGAGVDASGGARGLLAALRDHFPPVGACAALPPGIVAGLRPYQRVGVEWLASRAAAGVGAVLADDMGLGKTMQVLAFLLSERARRDVGPVLVVCPLSVIGSWRAELGRVAPALRAYVHHGPGRAGADALPHAVAHADLVLTTYTLLARDAAVLVTVDWDVLVLDEAQFVKNRGTAQSRAARALRAGRRIAVTGTPVENRVMDLHTLLDTVHPGLLGPPAAFRASFARAADETGVESSRQMVRAAVAPYVLRRLKTAPGIAADLPPKSEQTLHVPLTREQAVLYQAEVTAMMEGVREAEDARRRGRVLAGLTRLKQICNHPAHFLADGSGMRAGGRHRSGKLAVVDELVDAILESGEKALLFTQYRVFGAMLGPYLERRTGTEVPFLHGGLSRTEREELIARFQSADPNGLRLLLVSLRAAGTGVTLTAASHVIHLDRWWNPAVEDQATDRAHRLGQRRPVQVRALVCAGTIEERIARMLADKRELAAGVVGAGDEWIAGLDDERLFALLRLDEYQVDDDMVDDEAASIGDGEAE